MSALCAFSGRFAGFEPNKDAALFASLILNVEIWSVVIELLGVINPPPKGEDRRLFLGKGIRELDVALWRESACLRISLSGAWPEGVWFRVLA
jgi:hypothetical protein